MTKSSNVFAPVILALLLSLAVGTVATIAWRAAEDYLPSQNIEMPALAQHSPLVGRAAPCRSQPDGDGSCLSRRVVLVIIDGLRLQDSFGQPTLDRLRRAGVDAVARSHYPSISRPNHTTLVTGVPPLLSGVRNNYYRSPVLVDSLMDRLRPFDLEAAYIADYASSLAYLFTDDFEFLAYSKWPGGFTKAATSALNDDFTLLVLIPGAVDEAGHKHGGDSIEYRDAVDYVDQQLANIAGLIDLRYDTVIITADHGHTDAGGHGGEEQSVMEVPLIFAGAGIAPEALLADAVLADVPPTIAALLGVPAPGHSIGRTLVEVLDLSEAQRSALTSSDDLRIARNSGIYIDSLAEAAPALKTRRRNRLLLLTACIIVALACFGVAWRWGAMHVDWRVLVIAVPAFPICYYAVLGLVGQNLSYSAMPHRGEAMSRLFNFGLISVVVQLAAGWLALGGRVVLRERLASANALVACGLLVAWIPAGVLWALYDAAAPFEIPGSRIALLIPANYIAVATFALGAALLLGLEIVIFFARAVDPRVRLRRLERAAAKERRRIEKDE